MRCTNNFIYEFQGIGIFEGTMNNEIIRWYEYRKQ